MLANESEFEVLLTRYEGDPAICSKLLRTHALSDPKIFVGYAQKALLGRPLSRALKFLAGLAIGAGIMESLIDLYASSRTQAMLLAQKLIACEPRFDINFLEFVQRPRPDKAAEENIYHVGLDILDLISHGDLLVPSVLKVLKHSNPKVRSKAALFIGSRTQNLAWAASRSQEYDARVRANILESLFGINSDYVHQIFRSNVGDDNNRVAGNAILGLYLLGDTSAIPLIHDLARHPDARFRNTCAWVMGRSGDPRFAGAFSELMNDSDEVVRAQAFKGLGLIRKALRANANRPPLRPAIVKLNADREPSLVLTVHDASGTPVQGIPPTSFILKTGRPSKPVRYFSVEEQEGRGSFSVAFILCLPAEEEAAVEAQLLQAIEACERLRRTKDRWAILKLTAKTTSVRLGAATATYRQKWAILNVDLDVPAEIGTPDHQGFEYAPTPQRTEAMLRLKPITIGAGAEDEGVKLVLDSLLRVDAASDKPHLIFFGAGPLQHLIEPLKAKGPDVPAVVHILAKSAAWQAPEVSDLALKTGGSYREVATYAEFTDACFGAYSSLLHHYRIKWKDAPPDHLELDICCEEGKASVGYSGAEQNVMTEALSA